MKQKGGWEQRRLHTSLQNDGSSLLWASCRQIQELNKPENREEKPNCWEIMWIELTTQIIDDHCYVREVF